MQFDVNKWICYMSHQSCNTTQNKILMSSLDALYKYKEFLLVNKEVQVEGIGKKNKEDKARNS